MPRTSDPDRYPQEFFSLLTRASKGEVILIPPGEGKNPSGLRAYIQSFLKACETKPEWADTAKQIAVTTEDGKVRVSHRSMGKWAGLVREALGESPIEDLAKAQEAALARTLGAFPL